MKIVADDRIPFLKGVFEPYAQVVYLPGKSISREAVADADAVIVRTRTRCGKALFADSKVRCVATATIGFDHINGSELTECGIAWSNAPGCNADSVKNYIASALASMNGSLSGKTMGIIGVGHVGSRVAQVAEAFGMKVLLNDPPRAEKEGADAFTGLEKLLAESDIVSLHVPLERSGKYPTVNMADREFFRKMRRGAWFFNSCRGEVMDERAFLDAKKSGHLGGALIDVWPGEPDVSREMLENVEFGTPHIAGYSADGKANGTAAAVRFVAGELGFSGLQNWRPAELPPPVFPEIIDLRGVSDAESALKKAVLHTYDIRVDAEKLRREPENFEALRGSYWIRREFPAYKVKNAPPEIFETLLKLGFQLI